MRWAFTSYRPLSSRAVRHASSAFLSSVPSPYQQRRSVFQASRNSEDISTTCTPMRGSSFRFSPTFCHFACRSPIRNLQWLPRDYRKVHTRLLCERFILAAPGLQNYAPAYWTTFLPACAISLLATGRTMSTSRSDIFSVRSRPSGHSFPTRMSGEKVPPQIQVALQEDHLGKGGAKHRCILSANTLSVFLTSSAGRKLVTHNAHLTYARVTNEIFDAFLLAKVELSTLTTFVLVLTKPAIYGLPRPASSTSKRVNLMTGATPMKLPQLREFIVDNPSPGSCERMILKWAAQHLPDQLPFIFELPKGRLQRLEVVGFSSSAEVILHDWTEFVNAADEAYVRHEPMGLKYDLPIHAEEEGTTAET